MLGFAARLYLWGSVLACAAPVFAQTNITGIEVNQALGQQANGAMNFVSGKDTAIRVLLDAPAVINASLDQTSLEIVRDGTSIATLAALRGAPRCVFWCGR